MIEHSPIANLHVTSSFGHHVQKPFVAITTHSKDLQVQLSLKEARALAMHRLQAAAAAESDAFLITFLRKKIGEIDSHLITSILHDCKIGASSITNKGATLTLVTTPSATYASAQ